MYRQIQLIDLLRAVRSNVVIDSIVIRTLFCQGITTPYVIAIRADRILLYRLNRYGLYRQIQGVADTIAACRIEQGVVVRACGCNVLTTPHNRHVCFADRAVRCCSVRSSLYRQVQGIADAVAARLIANRIVIRALGCDILTAPYNRHVSFADDAVCSSSIQCRLNGQVQRVADAVAVGLLVPQRIVIDTLGRDCLTAP